MTASPGPENGAATGVRIPTLTTERLTLRAPGPKDFEPVAAFYASERAAMVGGPFDRPSAWLRFASLVGHWHLRGFGRWIVAARGGGEPLGIVGLHFPETWPEREIAWTLFAGAEGRGIAHEAARAARDHAYRALGWRAAVSLIKAGNARSEALARRLGAHREGDWEHPTAGFLGVWRHPGPEADAP